MEISERKVKIINVRVESKYINKIPKIALIPENPFDKQDVDYTLIATTDEEERHATPNTFCPHSR